MNSTHQTIPCSLCDALIPEYQDPPLCYACHEQKYVPWVMEWFHVTEDEGRDIFRLWTIPRVSELPANDHCRKCDHPMQQGSDKETRLCRPCALATLEKVDNGSGTGLRLIARIKANYGPFDDKEEQEESPDPTPEHEEKEEEEDDEDELLWKTSCLYCKARFPPDYSQYMYMCAACLERRFPSPTERERFRSNHERKCRGETEEQEQRRLQQEEEDEAERLWKTTCLYCKAPFPPDYSEYMYMCAACLERRFPSPAERERFTSNHERKCRGVAEEEEQREERDAALPLSTDKLASDIQTQLKLEEQDGQDLA